MKPLLFAISAMVFYAVANVTYSIYFSKVNNLVVLATWYVVMLPLTLLGLGIFKISGQEIVLPTRGQIFGIILVGIIMFAADAAFTGAYLSGGSLISIASIVVIFPALAAAIKYYVDGNAPNKYQLASYLLIVVAVLLAIKGSTTTTN